MKEELKGKIRELFRRLETEPHLQDFSIRLDYEGILYRLDSRFPFRVELGDAYEGSFKISFIAECFDAFVANGNRSFVCYPEHVGADLKGLFHLKNIVEDLVDASFICYPEFSVIADANTFGETYQAPTEFEVEGFNLLDREVVPGQPEKYLIIRVEHGE